MAVAMSPYIMGCLVIGLLLLTVSWGSQWINRLPLSYAIIYLVLGVILGPYGVGLINLQPGSEVLEHFTELVVIVSLYGCGLRINRSLKASHWRLTVRLVVWLMPLSILAVAAVGHWLLSLSWAAALLLGAILSPTDPVLASDVQLNHPKDQSKLRFGLTSEGGLNDALAFPFVYFGLHWIHDPDLSHWLRQWVLIDLLWAIAAAIVVGFGVAKSVVWLNHQAQTTKGLSEEMADLVALGVIFLTYGLTELVNGYGFLAVFVAGMVVRIHGFYPEQQQSQLRFITQIEKLLEVGAILLLGSLLRLEQISEFGLEAIILAAFLLLLIRPLGTWICTAGTRIHSSTRLLSGWFGIRGIGSLYYLSYAVSEGLPGPIIAELRWVTYLTVIISIVIHGITATPLVNWHERQLGKHQPESS